MRTLLARLATLALTVGALVACGYVDVTTKISSGSADTAYEGDPGAERKALQVVGSGPVKKENRRTGSFGKLRVAGAFQVEVRKGNPSVTVEAQQSLLKHIKTEVRNGELVVITEASMTADKPMKVWVTTKDLRALTVSGACSVTTDAYRADEFELELAGASKVSLPLTAKVLKADLEGASEATVTGNAPRLILDLSGASRFSGGNLRVSRATIDLEGASQADLRVDGEIKGDASGASSLRYRGNPKVSVDASDVSSVQKA